MPTRAAIEDVACRIDACGAARQHPQVAWRAGASGTDLPCRVAARRSTRERSGSADTTAGTCNTALTCWAHVATGATVGAVGAEGNAGRAACCLASRTRRADTVCAQARGRAPVSARAAVHLVARWVNARRGASEHAEKASCAGSATRAHRGRRITTVGAAAEKASRASARASHARLSYSAGIRACTTMPTVGHLVGAGRAACQCAFGARCACAVDARLGRTRATRCAARDHRCTAHTMPRLAGLSRRTCNTAGAAVRRICLKIRAVPVDAAMLWRTAGLGRCAVGYTRPREADVAMRTNVCTRSAMKGIEGEIDAASVAEAVP